MFIKLDITESFRTVHWKFLLPGAVKMFIEFKGMVMFNWEIKSYRSRQSVHANLRAGWLANPGGGVK